MNKLSIQGKARFVTAAFVACLIGTAALAGPGPQWTWAAGAQTNNGAIVLKSTNGSTTYSGTQNPTGAIAKVNQTAATQPPTVIVQATASLPIKAVGDACTQTTTGTAPSQSADEGTAITADRSLILTCQSGNKWKSAAASGLGVGQTWHNLTGTRVSGANYVNNTGAPIYACANTYMASWGVPQSWMYVDGVLVNQTQVGQSGQGSSGTTAACGVVPAGSTYSITCNTGCQNWAELY